MEYSSRSAVEETEEALTASSQSAVWEHFGFCHHCYYSKDEEEKIMAVCKHCATCIAQTWRNTSHVKAPLWRNARASKLL